MLNTALQFPNEPSATGLDFFADGHFTSQYETLGFYSRADFIELGRHFGVSEVEVNHLANQFNDRRGNIEQHIAHSHLSEEAKAQYLARFNDRLKALKNTLG